MAIDLTGKPPHPVSRSDALLARCLVLGRAPRRDVDDITQEVLCALAFRREPPERPAGRPRRTTERTHTTKRTRTATIAAAARKQLAEHARRQARLRRGDSLGAEVLSMRFTPSAEDLALTLEPAAMLRRALATLEQIEPALFAVLDLTAGGVSTTTAAAMLGIPAGTMCTRLRRARRVVRALLRRAARSRRAATGGA